MCKCGKIVGVLDAKSKSTGKQYRKLFCIGEEESNDNLKGSKVFELWAEGDLLTVDAFAVLGANITYVNVGNTYAIIDIEGLPE